jgi:hypothetical protein
MNYLKYRWNEIRGDERDDWGFSWWYSETDETGSSVRQLEIYDNGICLRYGPEHPEDEFGGLGYSSSFEDMDGDVEFITAEEFEKVWASGM